MRGKQVVVVLCLLTVMFAVIGAEPPSVSPWTSPPLTPGDVVALTAELDMLENLLADETLGSQQTEGRSGWDSHAFAQYTGGVLADLGYEVQLATDSHWPGGSHSWVLVNLAASAVNPMWVPVEAVPPVGFRQISLGTVPTQSISVSDIVFDPRYASFESASELASNRHPTARIRLLGSTLPLDVSSVIMALGSRDDDGEIVIYRWRLGDGDWTSVRSWSTLITPTIPGPMPITLQVIDNQGASATVSVQTTVIGPPLPPSDDCGCSK